MNYKDWEKRLNRLLKPLPAEEKDAAIGYYKEMYNDKRDAGFSAEDILDEFGSPKCCAERILNENGFSAPSIGKLIGWWVAIFFFTLILILPIYASLFSIVISFGAVTIAGGAAALIGGIYVLCSPFFAIQGIDFFGVLAHMGIGLACAGVGVLLAFGFFFATKYLFKWTTKSLVFIYKKR